MKFSYKWLQDYIQGTLPKPKELKEILTNFSFEVESIKKSGNDWILDIDVLPNRACDCLSHIGIAREIAVITGKKLKLPNLKSQLPKSKLVKLSIAPGLCNRYNALIVFGIHVSKSPEWIQERLKTCGLKPINNIVDITNYVMLETGQPLHAFDFDKLANNEIIIRKAKNKERITTLGGKEYELDNNDILIADPEKPLAIAGIKGGESTAIDYSTKNIVIEAANFNKSFIRRTSKKIRLKTDASWRFENGIDTELITFAQQRVVSLLEGKKIVKGVVDYYPKKAKTKKIKLNPDYARKLLGAQIKDKEMVNILTKLGFKVNKSFNVEVPTRRLDILIQEDLIEEIGRIYGYRNIPLIFPKETLIIPEKNEELLWERACKKRLKEKGFSEVYNYSFIGENDKKVFEWQESELIELENPISSFNKYLKPSLIPNLLKNIRENLKVFSEVKIFEIGKTFFRDKKIQEKKMLTIALTRKGIGDNGFYELKGIVDSFLNSLGISEILYIEKKELRSFWHPYRTASIIAEGTEIGLLGEINPFILNGQERVFIIDIDFEKLLKVVSEEQEYRPVSFYPEAVRDISLLVPKGTKTADILNVINSAGGSIVRDVDLFDIYQRNDGQENFSFHIIYQSDTRTLTSEEINKSQEKIIKALEENLNWEVRKE